jgi:DNA polymerase III sliding clamp (beta) subunit (PCNA family)
MKFQVSRASLLGALNHVMPVVGDSKQHPLLRCILISTKDGTMTVRATNWITSIIDSFPVDTSDEMEVCIEFGLLYPWIVNSYVLGRDILNVQVESNKVRIWYKGEQSKVTFPVLDHKDYPKVFEFGDTELLATTQGSQLATAIQRSLNVVVLKNTENNPMFQSGIMLVGNGELSFIVSDGYVMSYVKSKADTTGTGEYPIPLSALAAIDGMLSSGGVVRILHGHNRAVFQYGATTIGVMLNKTSFPVPQAKQMLSINHPGKSLVMKDGVTRAINSFRGFIDDIEKKVARSILVSFNTETKEMTISPNSIDDCRESLPIQQIIGQSCDFSINYVYWLNSLKAIDGLEAWVHYDPDSPQSWIHITGTNDNQRYVVAPFARNN